MTCVTSDVLDTVIFIDILVPIEKLAIVGLGSVDAVGLLPEGVAVKLAKVSCVVDSEKLVSSM